MNRRAVLYAIVGISIIEIPLVHLLLSQWSDMAAWMVTGLTAVAIGWLVVAALLTKDPPAAPVEDHQL